MTIYITSDLHFSHRNILKYEPTSRPWSTVEEMDGTLIRHWNLLVSPNDTIWHLGDFAFANPDKTNDILNQLNGTKKFIIGNHDKKNIHVLKEHGEVFDYKEIKHKDHHIVLLHYPISFWNRCDHGSLHFFGHLHGSHRPFNRSMDVGYDAHCRILTLDEAIDMIKDNPIERRREEAR